MDKIFDMHTHAFPKRIAAKTIATLSQKAHIPSFHDGSFTGLRDFEKKGGASGFLLLPIATKAASVRSINRWVAEKMGDGVYAFGTLHPDMENPREEIEYLLSLGLRGVKLHPEYQNFYVDEERMLPLYEALAAADLPVYFHAGADYGFPPPVRGDARRIARIADAFPRGRFIAAHMGGFEQYQDVRSSLQGRANVWMDTSFAAQRMVSADILALVRGHGVDKFFFGTDAPWSSFADARDALLLSGLSDAELEDIFWNNARRFLGIE